MQTKPLGYRAGTHFGGIPLNATAIFFPVMALMAWTVLALMTVAYRRFKAAFAGKVKVRDFKYGESSSVPEWVTVPNRVFKNLLEVPVLFYVLCIVAYVTQHVTETMILLAWIYVGLRFVHSLIYLTYNHVMHRFAAFATSNVVLVVMWAMMLWAINQTSKPL